MKHLKKILAIGFIIVTVSLISSCKKNELGGKATVILSPEHHENQIFGTTVYVKFDAVNLPSNPTSNYDLKVIADPTEAIITINELRPGNYYFYCEGYDPAFLDDVKGGIGITIKWSERKDEVSSSIPVTE